MLTPTPHGTTPQTMRVVNYKAVLFWAAMILLLVLGIRSCGRRHHEPSVPQAQPAAPAVAKPATTATEKPASAPELDMGKGSWVYALDSLELAQVSKKLDKASRQREQIRLIVAKAKKYRISYLIIRTSRHGAAVATCPDQLAAMLRDTCHKQGIKVWGYGRISAENVSAEVECAKHVLRLARDGGLDFDGYIYDAEGETKGKDSNVEAILTSVHSWLKTTTPDKRLAYSTYGVLEYHNFHKWFPRGLYDRYCHYAMPQLYWYSWRQKPLKWTIEESIAHVNEEWANCPIPVIPTVQSYGFIKPAEMTKFLAGIDTSCGFNAFRWELTGQGQWEALAAFECRAMAPAKAKAKGKKASKKPPALPMAQAGLTKSPQDLSGMIVVADPGHGGNDPGAHWEVKWKEGGKERSKIMWEASVTYPAAWQLAETLIARGAIVYLTAYDPCMQEENGARELPLPRAARYLADNSPVHTGKFHARYAMIRRAIRKLNSNPRKWKHVAFVSVHVDSVDGVKGAHVLCWPGATDLGQPISSQLARAGIGTPGNTLWEKTHRNGIQAPDANPLRLRALVEMGVPSNDPKDSWRLRNPSSRQQLLDCIASGLAAVNT